MVMASSWCRFDRLVVISIALFFLCCSCHVVLLVFLLGPSGAEGASSQLPSNPTISNYNNNNNAYYFEQQQQQQVPRGQQRQQQQPHQHQPQQQQQQEKQNYQQQQSYYYPNSDPQYYQPRQQQQYPRPQQQQSSVSSEQQRQKQQQKQIPEGQRIYYDDNPHQQQQQPLGREPEQPPTMGNDEPTAEQQGEEGDDAATASQEEQKGQVDVEEKEDTLPYGWSEHIDPSSGMPYYHNSLDGTTTWDRPTGVPRQQKQPPTDTTAKEDTATTGGSVTDSGEDKQDDGTSIPQDHELATTMSVDPSYGHLSEENDGHHVGSTEGDPTSGGAGMSEADDAADYRRDTEIGRKLTEDGNVVVDPYQRSEESIRAEEQWRQSQGWNKQQQPPDGGRASGVPGYGGQAATIPSVEGGGQWDYRDNDTPTYSKQHPQAVQGNAGWWSNDPRADPSVSIGTDRQGPPPVEKLQQPSKPEVPRQNQGPGWWGRTQGPTGPIPHDKEQTSVLTNQKQPPPEQGKGRPEARSPQHAPGQPRISGGPGQQSMHPSYGRTKQGEPGGAVRDPRYVQRNPQQSHQQQKQQQPPYPRRQEPPQQQNPYSEGQPMGQPYPYQFGPPGQQMQGNQYNGYSPPRPYPGPGGYKPQQGPPQLSSGQLVPAESQRAVRDALGSAWKGILGFRNRTIEAVGTAKDSVVTSAVGAGQSISTTSSALWGQTKNTFGSFFEKEDEGEYSYSLSGRYQATASQSGRVPIDFQQRQRQQQAPPPYRPQQQQRPQEQYHRQQGYQPRSMDPRMGRPPPNQRQPPMDQQYRQQRNDPSYASPPQRINRPSPGRQGGQQQQQQQQQVPPRNQWGLPGDARYPPPQYQDPNGDRRGDYQQRYQGGGQQQQAPQQQQPIRDNQLPPQGGQQERETQGDSHLDPWQHPGLGSDGF